MKQPIREPGSKVVINDGIPAFLLRVSIGIDDIEYQCMWWNEGDRKVVWLTEAEIGL